MIKLLNSVLSIGSLFVPARGKDGVREVGVLPWSFAFIVLVSGSCLAQKDEPFSVCTKSFIENVKGVIDL